MAKQEPTHGMFVRVPWTLWDAICRKAEAEGETVSAVVLALLAGPLKVKLPKPPRHGRPPKRKP